MAGLLATALLAVASTSHVPRANAGRPHILMLYIDDLGWGNVGFHRSAPQPVPPEVATPNLDALVAAGVELDRMYAYPFCAPSRAALFSGRMPQNVNTENIRGVTYDPAHPEIGGQGVPRNYTTIGQIAQNAGYRTAFAGKWDIGFATAGHVPRGRGFDSSLAYFFQVNDYWTQGMSGSEGVSCNKVMKTRPSDLRDLWLDDGPARDLNGTAYEEELFSSHLLRAVQNYSASGTADPLFLMYAPHLVHSPYQIPADWLAKFDFIKEKGDDIDGLRQVYAAMTHYVDGVVGNLTAAMKAVPGMWANTLVIAASDNGGPIQGSQGGSNFPLRGGKLTPWEGGIRVSSFFSGGFIRPAVRGTKVGALMHVADIWATIAEVTGSPATDAVAAASRLPPIDSLSLWGIISGTNATPPRSELYVAGVYYDHTGLKLMSGRPGEAVWTGPFYPNASTNFSAILSTVEDCSMHCLFDVGGADPGEHSNLAAARPADVARMAARMAVLSQTKFKPARGSGLDVRGCEAIDKNGGFWGPWIDH